MKSIETLNFYFLSIDRKIETQIADKLDEEKDFHVCEITFPLKGDAEIKFTGKPGMKNKIIKLIE